MRTTTDVDRARQTITGWTGWTVPFRGGSVCWRQRTEASVDGRHVAFVQTDGDLAELSGDWWLLPTAGGCEVRLELRYAVGVPIYDRILDPLFARVVAEAAATGLGALLDDVVVLESS